MTEKGLLPFRQEGDDSALRRRFPAENREGLGGKAAEGVPFQEPATAAIIKEGLKVWRQTPGQLPWAFGQIAFPQSRRQEAMAATQPVITEDFQEQPAVGPAADQFGQQKSEQFLGGGPAEEIAGPAEFQQAFEKGGDLFAAPAQIGEEGGEIAVVIKGFDTFTQPVEAAQGRVVEVGGGQDFVRRVPGADQAGVARMAVSGRTFRSPIWIWCGPMAKT
jgi:hypothetical protein